jgi:NAD(P)H-dependent FMN reductase
MSVCRALLVGGSLARPSHTGSLLCAAERALDMQGAVVERWDLAERPLPIADPALHSQPAALLADPVCAFLRGVSRADAIALASPLYHNSYSGVLKNALDHLGTRALEGKPVALLSHSGHLPSPQAVDQLRLVVRALLGIAIPTQVITVDRDWAREEGGFRLIPGAIEARLTAMTSELLWFAERLDGAAYAFQPVEQPAGALKR